MNNHNIIYVKTPTALWAEWADRAPDDDDRYAGDGVVLVAHVFRTQDELADKKRVRAKLSRVYDEWRRSVE